MNKIDFLKMTQSAWSSSSFSHFMSIEAGLLTNSYPICNKANAERQEMAKTGWYFLSKDQVNLDGCP